MALRPRQPIQAPPAFLDSEVVRALCVARRSVGSLEKGLWNAAVRRRDPVAILRRGLHRPVVCRAYFKLLEMEPLLPAATEVRRVALLCEAPGGFFQACRRLFPDAERFATSLSDGPDSIPFHPVVTPLTELPENGDVCHPSVMDALVERIGAHSCQLVTADGGVAHENLDYAEQHSLKLALAQIAAGLRLQDQNGALLIKVFEGSTQATRDILTLLRGLYDSVFLVKPRTSKAANSERYVVARRLQDCARADALAADLASLVQQDGFIETLVEAADAEVDLAFESLSRQQVNELQALADVASGRSSEKMLQTKAYADVRHVGEYAPNLRACVGRALTDSKKRARSQRSVNYRSSEASRKTPPHNDATF